MITHNCEFLVRSKVKVPDGYPVVFVEKCGATDHLCFTDTGADFRQCTRRTWLLEYAAKLQTRQNAIATAANGT